VGEELGNIGGKNLKPRAGRLLKPLRCPRINGTLVGCLELGSDPIDANEIQASEKMEGQSIMQRNFVLGIADQFLFGIIINSNYHYW